MGVARRILRYQPGANSTPMESSGTTSAKGYSIKGSFTDGTLKQSTDVPVGTGAQETRHRCASDGRLSGSPSAPWCLHPRRCAMDHAEQWQPTKGDGCRPVGPCRDHGPVWQIRVGCRKGSSLYHRYDGGQFFGGGLSVQNLEKRHGVLRDKRRESAAGLLDENQWPKVRCCRVSSAAVSRAWRKAPAGC